MDSTGPDNNLNSIEIEILGRLEAVVQRGLHTYTEVREALAEIRDDRLYRDTYPTFEAYLSGRWGINRPPLWRQDRDRLADLMGDRLFARLRWLLAQSSGTIADAAHQLESHPFDVDDDAREQLRDDVLVIEEELAMLRALLDSIDWDAEFERMLDGEIADFDDE